MNGGQLKLFGDETHRAAFEAFHQEHPDVLEDFVRLARQAVGAGRRRIGARLIFERIRWAYYIERKDGDFKINNNHAPYYAREAIARAPELEGVFELRELRTP